MAKNVFAGRIGVLYVASASSASASKLGAMRNFDVTYEGPSIDATSFDSSGYKQVIDGIKAWKMTAQAIVLSTSGTNYAQQSTLRAALKAGTREWFKFQNSTAATGSQTFQGWGYVTSWKQAGTLTDVQLHDFAVDGDGPLTES